MNRYFALAEAERGVRRRGNLRFHLEYLYGLEAVETTTLHAGLPPGIGG